MILHSTAVCSQLPPEFQNLWIIQAEIQFPQKFQNIEINWPQAFEWAGVSDTIPSQTTTRDFQKPCFKIMYHLHFVK